MKSFIHSTLSRYFKEFPVTMIDVGYRGGAANKWDYFGEYLRCIGFEPDKAEYDRLTKAGVSGTVFNVGLFDKKGAVDFNITRDGNLCSILTPNRELLDEFPEAGRYDVIKKIKLEVNTLDNVVADSGMKLIDFMKIDTQGTELPILQGASETLKQTVFGLEIEVEFVPLYRDQLLFSDLDQYLRERDFILFDLQQHFWRRRSGLGFDANIRGQLIHGNVLYFRKANQYISQLKAGGNSPDEIKAAILKAISISWMFGYSDYSAEICLEAKKAKYLTEIESVMIAEILKRSSPLTANLPDFPGRGRIAVVLKKMLNTFFPDNYHGWAMVSKADVGNRGT